MKKLNPLFLYAAVILAEDGARFGTVCNVAPDGDTLTVIGKGVQHTLSAKELDSAGRISKSGAKDKKYL